MQILGLLGMYFDAGCDSMSHEVFNCIQIGSGHTVSATDIYLFGYISTWSMKYRSLFYINCVQRDIGKIVFCKKKEKKSALQEGDL